MTKADELIQFEEEIKELYLAGKIRAPVHLVGGNEEQVIEVFKDIKPTDWVFSNYRSHYHALLKGIPADQLKRDILAGKSMHINSREHKFFTSSIVGGCLPIAVGVSMAIQRKGLPDWVWVFVGDMGASGGIFYECQKYSQRHNLPITFIVEDNGFSVESPTEEIWGKEKGKPNIIRYSYTKKHPHQGVGVFVSF